MAVTDCRAPVNVGVRTLRCAKSNWPGLLALVGENKTIQKCGKQHFPPPSNNVKDMKSQKNGYDANPGTYHIISLTPSGYVDVVETIIPQTGSAGCGQAVAAIQCVLTSTKMSA